MPHRQHSRLIPFLSHIATLTWIAIMTTTPGCTSPGGGWNSILHQRLALYGHRNIIAVVDSAYPAQSRPGIETIATGQSQTAVLREVLAELGNVRHVRPRIYLDQELERVPEADAPGISKYRSELKTLLKDAPVESLPHEAIIAKLDQTAQTFDVLILKSDLALPYTSVFIQLECGYWSDDAERRLRASLGPGK